MSSTTAPRSARKLAAILAADIAGYSTLVSADEERTVAKLRQVQAEVLPTIERFGGRVIDLAGDGILAEFSSAVRATEAALALQNQITVLNEQSEPALLFRIGINSGDVIFEADRLFGDGVNIAARLEALAPPGGICVSAKVHDEIAGKLEVTFVSKGPQALKNIPRHVEVFEWVADAAVGRRSVGALHNVKRGRLQTIGAVVVLAAASVAIVNSLGLLDIGRTKVLWQKMAKPLLNLGLPQADPLAKSVSSQSAQGTLAPAATAIPGQEGVGTVLPRLSLVVLPFANLNNDPEQDYFAEGITTDLTTDLAQIPGAFVIGRGTAFTYKGKGIDPKALGRELGVRYAMQGSVRRSGEQVRVNASLTDLATGADVWSDRFDGDRANLAALQDEIPSRLARNLNVGLIQAESRRSEIERPNNPDAVDLTMRGWSKFYEPRSQPGLSKAIELFDSALHLDPGNIDAMVGKAWSLTTEGVFQWATDKEKNFSEANELIEKALSSRPKDAVAHVAKGELRRIQGWLDESLEELGVALTINPNYAPAFGSRATTLIYLGRSNDALKNLETAMRLSPKDPNLSSWYYLRCHAHMHLALFLKAIESCRRSVSLNAKNWLPWIDLISAYGWLGHKEDAQQALAELNKIMPNYSVKKWASIKWSENPKFIEEYKVLTEGLRKGGLRED